MACIGCGLAQNADGKGRVDIDLNGGLTCTGSGGGLNNVAGSGISIKKDTTKADNSVVLSANGLYVPQPDRLDFRANNYCGGATAGPANTPEVSITVTNTSSTAKIYAWQASLDITFNPGNATGAGTQIEARIGGGAWFSVAGGYNPPNTWHSPFAGRVQIQTVNPGSTVIFYARAYVWTGSIANYCVNMVIWGGGKGT